MKNTLIILLIAIISLSLLTAINYEKKPINQNTFDETYQELKPYAYSQTSGTIQSVVEAFESIGRVISDISNFIGNIVGIGQNKIDNTIISNTQGIAVIRRSAWNNKKDNFFDLTFDINLNVAETSWILMPRSVFLGNQIYPANSIELKQAFFNTAEVNFRFYTHMYLIKLADQPSNGNIVLKAAVNSIVSIPRLSTAFIPFQNIVSEEIENQIINSIGYYDFQAVMKDIAEKTNYWFNQGNVNAIAPNASTEWLVNKWFLKGERP